MTRRLLVKDDLRYIIFSETYQKRQDPKGGRRAFTLLEAAIKCYSRRGFNSVTMEMIAREAGVTRPLLKHYFKDQNEIQILCVKYVRALFQSLAIADIDKNPKPIEILTSYIRACFHWVENHRTHSNFWFRFLLSCNTNSSLRALNSEVVQIGAERISAILNNGQRSEHSLIKARAIQAVIMGGMITLATEDLGEIQEAYKNGIISTCLALTASGDLSLAMESRL